MMKTLAGKVALVTGGSRGIGAAVVQKLAAAGAAVAFTYLQSEEQAQTLTRDIAAAGGSALPIKADTGDTATAANVVAQTIAALGRLDILVHNAGVIAGAAIDSTADQPALDRTYQVNVAGVAALTREAVPHLPNGGRIVSISSVVAGRIGGFAGFADYAAGKAAIEAYTQSWAWELGNRNITVNAVAPGPTATDMSPQDASIADAIRKSTALGRYGKPEEIAAAVAFLASPEASYITGAVLLADGGRNA